MGALTDGEQVYATLLLTDSYLPGALVLAHSLRDAGTSKKLAVFFTLDSISADSITQLQTVFDHVIPVPRIRNEHPANLYLMNRPDLDSAFTKINLWKQTQFSKIVYVDSDVVAYRAPDELFAIEHPFGAAPDIGWPDLFNTGVMVLTPNLGDYYALLAMAERGISFDGADQGLLNMYFKNTVHRLSFTYNVTPSAHYQYLPAFRHFQSSINMVHFIGPNKPWSEGRHVSHGASPYGEMVGRWWSVYDRHYHTQHEPSHSTSCGEPAQPQTQPGRQQQQPPLPRIHIQEPSDVHIPLTDIAHERQKADKKAHSRNQSWDAQRQPPPRDSKPEAENFPNAHYSMSQDVKPFVAPARYPSPPKNMWYEVPKQRPASSTQPPKGIFPWEGQQPQASRSFPATPDELAIADAVKTQQANPATQRTATGAGSTLTSTANHAPPPSIWSSFTLVNAWDGVPEINRYVERSRGHRRATSSRANLPASKSGEATPKPPSQEKPKFQGLKLTDFPTEVERPSLPVTPAPIRRPSFWGDDGEDSGNKDAAVPAAEGVPAQSEWNPREQLQKLAAQHSEELLRRLSGTDSESFGMFDESSSASAAPASSSGVLSPKPVKAGTMTSALQRPTSIGSQAD
ncbi:Glycosyl family 8 [Cordyceps militaris]|uniref:glycogenin glucosyltransferase n=1 Tax=Cordyceps militaris TaxID=73501 RepID=A0A2H4SUR9_CORMI|nr:Glycosyl family 8 [Cordyceps militaris]